MKFVTAVALMLLFAGTARSGNDPSETWLQRYHDKQHTSFISVPVDPMNSEVFRYTFDVSHTGDILIHYTDPKIEANGDLYVPTRDVQGGVITYGVQQISGGVEGWNFQSDYVRQPSGAWEPVFDFAINGGVVYVMGKFGCVWELQESDGTTLDKKCATDPIDPTGEPIWDVSPFTIDGGGNVYWTVRSSSSLITSSLIKLDPNGNITATSLSALAGVGQIAGNNSSPAVSADDSVIYVATTLSSQSGGKLLALDATDPTLTTMLWAGSLGAAMGCPEARLNDSGTSSPIALPDGGAAIGGWNVSPSSEGAYFSYDSSGNVRGCYRFGWDDTMGQITLNGTTYLVGKHNHYTSGSSQCNNGIDPPVNAPCYEIVLLNSVTMVKQWSYISTNGFEFCIDAPTLHKTVDGSGNETGWVTAPSESGDLYQVVLSSNPPNETHFHVGAPQNAAYVPTVSIGGPAYTINHSQVIGVGNSN